MLKAIIIHGWGFTPQSNWYPWLKTQLEQQGWEVVVPTMPDTENPKIEPWVNKVKEISQNLNQDTYLVGHSIGCQTILRYLETLPADIKIDGILLVAPWLELDQATIKEEGEEAIAIAKPWIDTPIDFIKINQQTDKIVAIFSDDDPFVPIEQKDSFANLLNAKTIVVNGAGHFDDSEYSIILESLLKMAG